MRNNIKIITIFTKPIDSYNSFCYIYGIGNNQPRITE